VDEQKNAPVLPIGRFLKSKSPGGNWVISVVIDMHSTKQIQQDLNRLKNLPLWDSWRLLDVQSFDFGNRIQHTHRNGGSSEHGELILRVTTTWRIAQDNQILVGSLDRQLPDWNSQEESERHTLLDALMRSWLNSCCNNPRTVTEVIVEELGGATLFFSDASYLQILPTRSQGELWRLLFPDKGREKHLVINSDEIYFDYTDE
jgi:hypothetical protein